LADTRYLIGAAAVDVKVAVFDFASGPTENSPFEWFVTSETVPFKRPFAA
jgi:hypothetical protein